MVAWQAPASLLRKNVNELPTMCNRNNLVCLLFKLNLTYTETSPSFAEVIKRNVYRGTDETSFYHIRREVCNWNRFELVTQLHQLQLMHLWYFCRARRRRSPRGIPRLRYRYPQDNMILALTESDRVIYVVCLSRGSPILQTRTIHLVRLNGRFPWGDGALFWGKRRVFP